MGHADCKKKTRQLCLQPHQKFHAFLATRMDDVARVAIQHLEYSTFMYFLNIKL